MRNTPWFLVALVVCAFGLRVAALGTRPFDGDEGVIVEAASRSSLEATIHRAYDDVHPPGEVVLTHAFLKILPFSETTSRLPSVLAGTLAILGIFLLVRHYTNEQVALVTALLATVSPYLILFSQEQRMYSLLLASVVFTIFWLEDYLRYRRIGSLVGFVLAGTLTLYTHHLALVVHAAIAVGLLLNWPQTKKVWQPLLASYGVLFLLYLPQLPHTIQQTVGRVHEQTVGLSLAASLKGLANMLYRFGAGRLTLGLEPSAKYFLALIEQHPWEALTLVVAVVVPLTLLVIGWRSYGQVRGQSLILPLLVTGFLLLTALLSVEVGGRAVRNLIIVSPIYFTLLAIGCLTMWKKPWGRWLPIVLLIVFALGIGKQTRVDYHAAGANTVADFLAQHAKAGDVVLARGSFLAGESFILDYYLKKELPTPALTVVDFFGEYKVGNLAELKSQTAEEMTGRLRPATGTVWYYDFSYSGDRPSHAAPHDLGNDKEGHPLVLDEITSVSR